MNADPTLAADIDACCRISGTFTLRAGEVATEYFDKYLFEADPVLLARIADRMVDLLPDDTELIGGLELGGVPIATVVSSPEGTNPLAGVDVELHGVLTKAELDAARSAQPHR